MQDEPPRALPGPDAAAPSSPALAARGAPQPQGGEPAGPGALAPQTPTRTPAAVTARPPDAGAAEEPTPKRQRVGLADPDSDRGRLTPAEVEAAEQLGALIGTAPPQTPPPGRRAPPRAVRNQAPPPMADPNAEEVAEARLALGAELLGYEPEPESWLTPDTLRAMGPLNPMAWQPAVVGGLRARLALAGLSDNVACAVCLREFGKKNKVLRRKLRRGGRRLSRDKNGERKGFKNNGELVCLSCNRTRFRLVVRAPPPAETSVIELQSVHYCCYCHAWEDGAFVDLPDGLQCQSRIQKNISRRSPAPAVGGGGAAVGAGGSPGSGGDEW